MSKNRYLGWQLIAGLACLQLPSAACMAAAMPAASDDATAESTGATDDDTLLPTMVVNGWYASQYLVPRTSSATGTNTPLVDIAQSIEVIPEAVLRDQGSESIADAVRNSPGVAVNMGEGMRDEVYLRGVKTKYDFFTDGLRDDTEYMRDLYNVSHVDVLQGPAALLFGRGGAGGLINIVTKQPERRSIRNASIEFGSWGHLRGTADVGSAIGDAGAFRLLAMGEDSGGFRDDYFLHRYAINPKFSFQLGEDTRLDLSASHLNDRRIVDRGITSEDGRPVDVPRGTFFGAPDQNMSVGHVSAFAARFTHAFNENLTLNSSLRTSYADRQYENTYAGSAPDANGQFKMKGYAHDHKRHGYIGHTDLVADLGAGAVTHTLLFGADYSWQRDHDFQLLPSEGSKNVPGRYPVSNPEIAPIVFPYLDRDNRVLGKELGLYVQDQVSFGEHWKAIFGTRWDRFTVNADYLNPAVSPDNTYNVDTTWSPRAGLIFKPTANYSIYASVTKAFTPQGANIALSRKSPDGANLDPEKAINYEIGNKLDLFDGQLLLSAAVFRLNLDDVVAEAADGSGDLVNTGSQRNKGFSVSAEGALTSNWSIYANYTHMNARITKATEEADAGAHVGLVPSNQFSVWTRYALDSHWGIGAGAHGESKKYTSYDNHVQLPGYVVGDLMAYYQAERFRVQLNLNNVTDRHYFPTASSDFEIMPGEPRNLMLTLDMNF
ncbi:TonB-dependent receptor [Dokdonella fugitiva]|jgi:catecholate siderophore receptor|uniref:TonB-dependent receptor n=1 Tax=Dokdonella fugitiva TaxID=328517 RepID=UPI0015FB0A49|nr:TonB-dependent siderophore receptor [Dokdonella fugitiva]MBA8882399.1 catecholate siderophore receptor [Dokdonella fugitiva]